MTRTIWSTMLPRLTAASTPSGTPMQAPISVPSVASSIVAGKTRRMSVMTGLVVSTEVPKFAGQRVLHIDVELLIERQVEAHLLARPLDDAGRRAVAERSPAPDRSG